MTWPYRKRRSKYNSVTCTCEAGHFHHSRFEAGYCNDLHRLKRAGEISEIQTQVRYSFDINGLHITNYYADFLVTDKDGMVSVRETKGMVTDIYIIKKRLFAALYPEIPFHEINY